MPGHEIDPAEGRGLSGADLSSENHLARLAHEDQVERAPQDDRTGQGKMTNPESVLDATFRSYVLEPERREPHPQDLFHVRLRPEMPEYEILLDAGATDEQLHSHTFTREALLDAGYCFVNRIGGGEKAIISGKIPDPAHPTKELDFTDRALLTRRELEAVYAYQSAHPEIYGLRGEDLDEVRKDMLSFLITATHRPVFPYNNSFVQQALGSVHPDFYGRFTNTIWDEIGARGTEERDIETVDLYWQHQKQMYQEARPDQNSVQVELAVVEQFAKTHCGDIYQWNDDEASSSPFGEKEVRGHPVNSLAIRRGKLSGQGSPFLESSYVFGSNLDAGVYGIRLPNGSFQFMRINTASLHLSGGHPDFPGLSEMGGSSDQIYIPVGLYVDQLYLRDQQARVALHQREASALNEASSEEIASEAQRRLINVAHQWRETQVPQESSFQQRMMARLRTGWERLRRDI
ncbi:MAG: hypothetical protein J2P37_32655 [Ktedonobacteraceae bacterium]|nr:hypothetical protein [Ktedonobacteraceae bacterium]